MHARVSNNGLLGAQLPDMGGRHQAKQQTYHEVSLRSWFH